MDFAAFLDRLRHLKRARVGGVAMPYKPLLVAAVVLLIHKRKILTPDVMLDGGLRSAFAQLLAALYPGWPYRTKVEYPFRHLETDGVWSLVPLEGASDAFRAAKDAHAEAWHILRHVSCARLPAGVFERLSMRFEDRVHALQALWEAFLPPDAALKLMRFMTSEEDAAVPKPASAIDIETLTERALEEHLELHWPQTPFARMGVSLSRPEVNGFAGRQVFTPVNAIALLGFRAASREWWVFELKRGRPGDAVVGQVSRYLAWMSEQRRGHREHVRGAIIARRADRKLLYSVRANPRLSLWLFDERLEVRQAA